MKIQSMEQLNDFIYAVDKCKGMVYLVASDGEQYDLKPNFDQYRAVGQLLSERGDEMELFCSNKRDEHHLFAFFRKHPEVQY